MTTLVGTYYDIAKLVLWADDSAVTEGENKRPRLVFSFRDGNPRISVYTGAAGQNGVISFPSDYPTMVSIITLLKDVIAGQPGIKFSIDSLTSVYENNKPTKDKKVVSTLYIGKSKEGVVYFSVISEAKPKIIFSIKPSPFHVFRDGDKNVIPESVMSCKIATGLAEMILNIISDVICNYTEQEYSTGRKPTLIKSQQGQQTQSKTTDISGDLDDLGL